MTTKHRNKNFHKLHALFSEFISLTNEVLIDFDNSNNITYHKEIFFQLLQRLNIGIAAVDVLFEKFNCEEHYKYPIGLQIRTCILDSITIYYLFHFFDPNDDKAFRAQFARLNKIVAQEYCSEIEENIKNKKLSVVDYNKAFKIIANVFPDNFTKDTNPKIIDSIKVILPNDMVNHIKGSQLSWFSECYKLYKYYCKYEHFGTISKKILDFNSNFDIDKLTISFFYIMQSAYLTCQILEADRNNIERMKSLRDTINEFEPLLKTL
ncbi:MAG TPA: hypothetical protein PLE28_03695 [bacterium]|nr:hypothetical protein [bacterium]